MNTNIDTMNNIYIREFEQAQRDLLAMVEQEKISKEDFHQLAINQLEILQKVFPENIYYVSRQAELYQLDGNLRKANELYQQVLKQDPVQPLTEKEESFIYKFCPVLWINPREFFPLKDVVAIHHPEKPLIGYHLFWEDDYDFPDDHEPSDHEEIWIEYDRKREVVTRVMTYFHSRVLTSHDAVKESWVNEQRAIIRVEWGKHGSLVKGWENMNDPLTGTPIMDQMKQTFEALKKGGRNPHHPLKNIGLIDLKGQWKII